MKNGLLCIFACLAVFAACKKELTDPWANTDFESTTNYTLTVDANNNITEYITEIDSNNSYTRVAFNYVGDTLAERIIYDINNQILGKTTYYLNTNGYADSSYTYSYNGSDTTLQKCMYTYNADGYLTATTLPGYYAFIYANGNMSSHSDLQTQFRKLTYTNYLSNVDIAIPYFRGFDNVLTGKNDINLVEKDSVHTLPGPHEYSTTTYYYYDINSKGYITRYITKTVKAGYYSGTTYKKYNFSYVIQ